MFSGVPADSTPVGPHAGTWERPHTGDRGSMAGVPGNEYNDATIEPILRQVGAKLQMSPGKTRGLA